VNRGKRRRSPKRPKTPSTALLSRLQPGGKRGKRRKKKRKGGGKREISGFSAVLPQGGRKGSGNDFALFLPELLPQRGKGKKRRRKVGGSFAVGRCLWPRGEVRKFVVRAACCLVTRRGGGREREKRGRGLLLPFS